jgi:23S rRNA (uracil1939-C5)-methyltransferase
MAYPAQLRLKEKHLLDALQRIGGCDSAAALLRPIIGMADPWHYRGKVSLPISGNQRKPQIGFFAARTHRVTDSTVCRVQPKVCDEIRAAVRDYIRDYQVEPYKEATHSGLLRHLFIRTGLASGDILVGLVVNGTSIPDPEGLIAKLQDRISARTAQAEHAWHLSGVVLSHNRQRTNQIQGETYTLLYGRAWIEEKILGLSYRISPASFFQINPRQTEYLYASILDLADLSGREQVLDLYCGTGSISLQLARRAAHVTGIEIAPQAIEDARINACLNGINNVSFQIGSAESQVPNLARLGIQPDLVVVDPPRKGCDQAMLDTLANLEPPRLIYVSCNPATLARDIARLRPAGYAVQAIQPVDLFPWTGHVETVVLMSKEK